MHGNVEDKTDEGEIDDSGTAAIAEKWKRNADNRHDAYDHTCIDENLPEKIKENPSCQCAAESISGVANSAENRQQKQRKESH